MRQGIMWKDAFQSSLETMDFGKIFMRQNILLGHSLCDRVQDVERFATHPHHFPSQVPFRAPGSRHPLKLLYWLEGSKAFLKSLHHLY